MNKFENYIIAVFIMAVILALCIVNEALEMRAILYAYQSEIAYLRQQQEANQRTIEYLTDQYFEMRELMRHAAKNQIP